MLRFVKLSDSNNQTKCLFTRDLWLVLREFERLNQIADRNGWTKFVSKQNQYNLIYREEERETMSLYQDRHIAVVPWSPLAGGRTAHPWGTKTVRNSIDEILVC